jgi:hypothetical protein
VYCFFYHEFINKMKSKTNANQKQTYTHCKNNSLVPKNKHTHTVRINISLNFDISIDTLGCRVADRFIDLQVEQLYICRKHFIYLFHIWK